MQKAFTHYYHIPDNSNNFGPVLNYIVDQIGELKIEVDSMYARCINIEHKLSTDTTDLNNKLIEIKEQVQQLGLSLTNEVRHQSNKEVSPNKEKIVPYKYKYPF